MEDILTEVRNLFRERTVSMGWLTGLLGLAIVYALGYLCGILPSLWNRKRRKVQEETAMLRKEILDKMCEHGELYNQYMRERDSAKRTLMAQQITELKEDLKRLEPRLAVLERRGSRKLPLRPLPVSKLKIK